ncbi:MAG: NAD-dependent DNA ligase LigA [Myxococcota bacterium]|nr:NAD-dependent DNA ligase LigA [Myxococcota bacterium]
MTANAIDELAKEIRRHRDLYYNSTPAISDAEFDALEDRLRELDPTHPVLAEIGAPASERAPMQPVPGGRPQSLEWLHKTSTRFYAGDITVNKQTEKDYAYTYASYSDQDPLAPELKFVVPPAGQWGRDWPKQEHVIAMGSLNKVNEAQELRAWVKRCDELTDENAPSIGHDLALTEKLDGISLALVYEDGKLDRAITRGDGKTGERITSNVMHMQGVPAEINLKGTVSVRGEIILRKSDERELTLLRQETDKNFKSESLRNTAAGAARSKNPHMLPGCAFLTALFYDLSTDTPLKNEEDKFAAIEELGFTTPFFFRGSIDDVLNQYRSYEEEKRASLDYEIDGLVIRANDITLQNTLGDLNNRPRAAVAFKFGNEMGVTKLIEIEWQTGDSGRVTPVAEVEPIRLAGATIRHASLHNLANIKKLGVAIGDEVVVSRRNDVIPYIEKVENKGPNIFVAPKICSQCGEPIHLENEYLYCRNPKCPAIRQGRLKTWINTLDFQGWGEERIRLIFEHGLASEPADLYKLSIDALENLRKPPVIVDGKKKKPPKLGKKNARLMLEPLLATREITLPIFIAALGIESVSKETAKLLVDAGYDSFEKIWAATREELADIHGLGEIKAEKIITGLADRKDEIHRLQEAGIVAISPVSKSDKAGSLSGLSFCFSGSHSKPRKQLQALVEDNGGEIRSGVSKGLSYLVLADPSSTSSKATKARKLGTEVIGEDSFMALIEGSE